MSAEIELLKKILATGWLNNTISCEVEELLAQPEQNTTQYLLDQVARLTAENAMLKEKWSTPKREPITGIEISQGFQTDDDATHPYSYWSGVDFAEKCHGIGGGE